MDNGSKINEEYNPDIITLSDESGKEYAFEVLDAIETDLGRYLALLPIFDFPEESVMDSGELIVLKVLEEGGESFYEEIDDDDEYDTIADIFIERLQDFFEIEQK